MKTSAVRNLSRLASALMLLAVVCSVHAAETTGTEFFEQKIRPILVDNCYKCHSSQSEKVKGGLLVDTHDALLEGGETGTAITPGDPEKSLLIKAVRYIDKDLQMPPKGKKLSAVQIADLEAWVKMGAPDPRTGTPATKPNDIASKSRTHWAFQPVRKPSLPEVKNKKWIRTPVDAFVLAKLEANHLKPSPPADRRTLIRRATFDLTGLPPTPEEVDAFLKDKSPNAYAKVIERLLASPRYGERWGRHWLDIARYADTKGYVFQEERRYPFSYTYRDYVIKSFNNDLPYNQFIIEQLAADQLTLGENKEALAAMGFLTLGRRFLNNETDIIDDRIDVTCRGLLGLTVGCARCHDHKFDPIPTKDYYSLYGVFASSKEPREKPLLGVAPKGKLSEEYEKEKKRRTDELENFEHTKQEEKLAELRHQLPNYLLVWHDLQHLADKSKADHLAQERQLDNGVLERWKSSLEKWKQQTNAIFTPWFAFSDLAETNFAANAKLLAAQLAANKDHAINPLIAQAFTNAPTNIQAVAGLYGKVFNNVDVQWRKLLEDHRKQNKDAAEPTALADQNAEKLRGILYGSDAPPAVPRHELHRMYDVASSQHIAELRRLVDELDATHPGAPPRAMSMIDREDPVTPHVFIRGNAGNPGPEVPRQFLLVVAGENRKPFQKGSGRLELAQAIASRDNPLTPRVLANRVWLHHFGKGLVKTPSDFGLRSEPPTHPELLDWLASEFIDGGWSIKNLHRLIMLSSTYQQSGDSDSDKAGASVDPENHLCWKMNRQRLDFEELRDSLLFVSGKMDKTTGGQPVDIISQPFSPRRTVYGYIDRQNLPGLFRTFDFANPDSTSPLRFSTTVPQQALFLLNSPFVVEQAQIITTNSDFAKLPNEKKKIESLYRRIYQREPDREEIKLAERFIKKQSSLPLHTKSSAWQYGYGTLDEAKKRVTAFNPFTYFDGKHWQHSAQFPDPQTAYAMLDIEGGHPGSHSYYAVIRRWISPFDGNVDISGTLQHIMDKGDGVRSRIVSSRHGILGEWVAFHDETETALKNIEVRRGDTIDFVTDCREGPAYDTFKWTTVLKVAEVKYGAPQPEQMDWHSRRDFEGPPPDTRHLTAWEKYTQALLLSNEFVFLD